MAKQLILLLCGPALLLDALPQTVPEFVFHRKHAQDL